MDLFFDNDAMVCVTSEDAVLHSRAELELFVERYASGPTTYSWEWRRRQVAAQEGGAWLLAEGTETAAGERGETRSEYRMTLAFVRAGGRWAIAQIHGSSPHHPEIASS